MMWNTRKYFDDETRKNLQEAIKDEALLKQVELAYESSLRDVERKEVEMQEAYTRVAGLLAQTSEISGVSQEHLLIIARRIASTEQEMHWYRVLGMIYSFYRIERSLRELEERQR